MGWEGTTPTVGRLHGWSFTPRLLVPLSLPPSPPLPIAGFVVPTLTGPFRVIPDNLPLLVVGYNAEDPLSRRVEWRRAVLLLTAAAHPHSRAAMQHRAVICPHSPLQVHVHWGRLSERHAGASTPEQQLPVY